MTAGLPSRRAPQGSPAVFQGLRMAAPWHTFGLSVELGGAEYEMTLDELKKAVQSLSPEERRRLALHILELEKDHFKDAVGPQIKEDLDALGSVLQETLEKIKTRLR